MNSKILASTATRPAARGASAYAHGQDSDATVQGTSMEPNIADGATIDIDTGDQTIKSGKIYAFRQNEMLRVKLLYHTPQGGLRIVSYNKEEYPEETVSPEAMEDIHVIGRVFGFSVMMK